MYSRNGPAVTDKLLYSPTPEFNKWLVEHGPLDVAKYVAELEIAERNGLTERKIDDYDAATEEKIWHETKRRSEEPRRFRFFGPHPNRPALTFPLQVKMLSRILRQDKDCRTLIDFGALYAKVAADAAMAFPDASVFAVDRSENVKNLNEAAFPGISNLHFVAEDIFRFMSSTPLTGGVLSHSLTAVCLLPQAMRKLYSQCAASGIRHIVLIELTGYSHQLQRMYEFSDRPQPSAVYRQSMLLHDYPNMLRAAGYKIDSAELIPCPMPKPIQRDAHLIALSASLS